MQIFSSRQFPGSEAHSLPSRAGLRRNAKGGSPSPGVRRSVRSAGLLALMGMLFGFLISAMPCLAIAAPLTPENRRDIELQPGVVLIVVSFEATLGEGISCKPSALGTGFLYRPDGYLITNGHVAQWANGKDSQAANARMKEAVPCLAKEVVKQTETKLGRKLTDDEENSLLAQVVQAVRNGGVQIGAPSLHVLLDNGTNLPGEIKAYSDPIDEGGKDIAIIKVDGKNLPTVELGNSDDVNVGDPITVIGYPGAATNAAFSGIFSEHSVLLATVTNGRISAVNKTDYKGTPVLQSEAAINPGNSGGPAFDANGRVVGIATYNLKDAANLNFFVPINTALEFVRQAGAPPERGSFDQAWHIALDAYVGQHWSKAHELLGSVLEMMPDQPDAKKLQLQAAENIPSNPVLRLMDQLGMPAFLAIIVAVLAILAGAAFVMLRKPAVKRPSGGTVVLEPRNPVPVQPPPLVQEPVKVAALPAQESFGSLHIANGPLAGNRFPIPKNGVLIGRDPTRCALVLPSDTASKEHAWVVPLDNGVAVIDRNSSNGTYVNSTESPRINKVVLKNGDRIFIGRKDATEITYFSS